MHPRQDLAEVDGRKLNIREAGPVRGRPVLIITGIGCNVELFAPFQDSLKARHTIAFDAPGVGRSDAPDGHASIRYYATVAARLIETLVEGPVDVVGYSFGGAVAQQLAHDRPSLVRRLVLVATTCGWGGMPGDPLAVGAILTPMRFYSRTVHDLTMPLMGPAPATEDAAVLEQQRKARTAAPPSLLGYWAQCKAFCTWSSWPWLPSLHQPTLVVAGEHDRLIPPVNGEMLASRLPNARLVVVPGQGHHFLADPAITEVRGIRDFLDAAAAEKSPTWHAGRSLHRVTVPLSPNPVSWPLEAASTMWRWVYS